MDRTDFVQFHHDLTAALIADIPLVGGPDHRLTESELMTLQRQLAALTLEPQRSVDEANAATWPDDNLPKWYRAALTVFAKTGSTLPVLEGLSVGPLAIRDVTRALRWTSIYLFIVAATALLGLCLFDLLVVPAIRSFREDLLLTAAGEISRRFDVLPWLPWIIAALAVGLVMGLLGILVGGIANVAPWLGGRRYVRCAVSMTVLRISQSLVQAEMAVNEAVAIAFALTGAEAQVRQEVQSMIEGCDQAHAIGHMADCMRLTVNNRLARLRNVTPVLVTAMLGGGLAVIYCLIVFWPIVSLFKDLPTEGL